MRLPPLGPLRERARERLEELADALSSPAYDLVPRAAASLELDGPGPAAHAVDRRANNGNGNDKANGNGNGKGNSANANGVANGSGNNGNGNGNGNGNSATISSAAAPASPATTPGAAPTTPYGAAATAGSGPGSTNGDGAAGGTPTSAVDAGGSTPTQASTNGGGNAAGNGAASPGFANSPPAVQGQNADPPPTAGAVSGPGPGVIDSSYVAATMQQGSSPTPATGNTPTATTSSAFTSNGVTSTNWGGLTGSGGTSYGSGTVGKGDSSDASRNAEGGTDNTGGSHPSSMPAIVGGLIAVVVLLILLLALLLYKYRYKRRVQDFLARFTPFHSAPYTELEKKRASIGEDLLFTDSSHGDSLMADDRSVALLAATSTPKLAPLSSPAVPSLVGTALLPDPRISPVEVSPLSLTFLQSPPPTASLPGRRTSQDSLISIVSAGSSGIFSPSLLLPSDNPGLHNYTHDARRCASQDSLVSVASSGIFSPSMLSWPMPPPSTSSRAVSVAAASPPATSASMRASLEGWVARYRPLTPTKVGPPLSVTPPLQAMPAVPLPLVPAQGGRGGG